MRPLASMKNSLTFRLMLAFLLVAVPSVLLSSQVATRMAIGVFNGAIESWLRETTDYVTGAVEETGDELAGVFVLLRERVSAPQVRFSREETHALRQSGVDGLLVTDPGGAVLFQTGDIMDIAPAPLYPEGTLHRAALAGGEEALAIALEREVLLPEGERRRVWLAEIFSLAPYAAGTSSPSLVLRLFVPDGDGFAQVFSSSGDSLGVPAGVARALQGGAEDVFVPDADWTDNSGDPHLFFKPLRDRRGNIRAVLATSAALPGLDAFIAHTSRLFWTLFLGGCLISGSLGALLARYIVRPIQALEKGVARIAAGGLGHQVPIAGNDEIARLGRGLNVMSAQLAAMQREKAASVKRERARMLGEIALGFAHEIRNPLLVIKTSVEMLCNRQSGKGADPRLLGFVAEEAERINALVSDFLAFAKPGAPVLAPSSLTDLAAGALAVCRASLEQKGIVHSLENSAASDVALCDAGQVRQVLLNLILNAVDAMPSGGRLDVGIREADAETLCLEVADTGCGMSEELLASAHLPFVSTKEKGLGLGLAKAWAIMEEHGGSISCSSRENTGARFILTFKKQTG